MKKLKVILIGAGNRGMTYTRYMKEMPEKFEVVAVAEPRDSRREFIKNQHNLPDSMCFTDYKPLLELGKIADVALICTHVSRRMLVILTRSSVSLMERMTMLSVRP